jgi:hypothetical protein
MVRPLYDCRVEDLGPSDVLIVECGCGHTEHLTPAMLKTAGVKPYSKLLDLKSRLKCKSCRWKGRATVSVRWAE